MVDRARISLMLACPALLFLCCVLFVSFKPRVLGGQFEEVVGYDGDELISDFGGEEFHCYGSCACEEEDEERRGIIPYTLGRTVSLLVTALSVVVAEEKARNHFSGSCSEELSETCHLSRIKLVFDGCESEKRSETEEKGTKFSINERVFHCEGSCLKKKLRRNQTIEMARKFRCDKLVLTGEVIVQYSRTDIDTVSFIPFTSRARKKFLKEQLVGFCKKMGNSRYHYTSPGGKKRWLNVKLCVASHSPSSKNISIDCVQMSPKASSYVVPDGFKEEEEEE